MIDFRPRPPKRRSAPNPPTLATLRKRAPAQDRAVPALAATSEPNGYRNKLFASTLDELRQRCGEYGEAAVTDARWSAVSGWLMRDWKDVELTHAFPVAVTSVLLCRDNDRARLKHPGAKPDMVNIMAGISAESQQEAAEVGAATVKDWEAAGCPGLNADRIRRAQQYLFGCLRQSAEALA